jgi:hypothetical protein
VTEGSRHIQPVQVCGMDTWVQAIQLSPCHPGLDRLATERFGCIRLFLTCCFPLRLSVSGRSGVPGVSRSTPPRFPGDQDQPQKKRRTATMQRCNDERGLIVGARNCGTFDERQGERVRGRFLPGREDPPGSIAHPGRRGVRGSMGFMTDDGRRRLQRDGSGGPSAGFRSGGQTYGPMCCTA